MHLKYGYTPFAIICCGKSYFANLSCNNPIFVFLTSLLHISLHISLICFLFFRELDFPSQKQGAKIEKNLWFQKPFIIFLSKPDLSSLQAPRCPMSDGLFPPDIGLVIRFPGVIFRGASVHIPAHEPPYSRLRAPIFPLTGVHIPRFFCFYNRNTSRTIPFLPIFAHPIAPKSDPFKAKPSWKRNESDS